MVRLRPLEPRIGVRVPASQPNSFRKRFASLRVYPQEHSCKPAGSLVFNRMGVLRRPRF